MFLIREEKVIDLGIKNENVFDRDTKVCVLSIYFNKYGKYSIIEGADAYILGKVKILKKKMRKSLMVFTKVQNPLGLKINPSSEKMPLYTLDVQNQLTIYF